MPVYAMTWRDVHVGDVALGKDGAGWRIYGREPGERWIGAGGQNDVFVMRSMRDGREIRASMELRQSVTLIERADHSNNAEAAQVLLNAGFTIQILREGSMTDTPEEHETGGIETFGGPACAHPADALRAIIDGSTWCSACKSTVYTSGVDVPATTAVIADPAPRREPPMGRWGWYKLPHPLTGEDDKLWPRVSTIAKTLADESGLTAWKLRMVAKGISIRPDLIAVVAALDVEMDKSKVDEAVKSGMEAAQTKKGANFGTALHKFAERLDDGEGIGSMNVPASLVADLEAYARALRDHGLEVLPQYSERTIVNATLNYAGTWDRIVRHKRTGVRQVLDVKTGQDLSYSWLEIGIQEAGYANGEWVAVRTFDGYEPMPDVDKTKALVLHLPIGSARGEIYGVDIVKGWRSLHTSLDARE